MRYVSTSFKHYRVVKTSNVMVECCLFIQGLSACVVHSRLARWFFPPSSPPPPHSHCVQWMTAIGNQSNPEHLSLSVVAKAPQVPGGNEGKKVVEEREKIKKWVSRELSSKKQGKG